MSFRLDIDMPIQSSSNNEVEGVDMDYLLEESVDTDLLLSFDNLVPVHSATNGLTRLLDITPSNGSDLSKGGPRLDQETKAAWHKAVQACDQSLTFSWSDCSAPPSHVASSIGTESGSDSESSTFQGIIGSDREQLQSMSQPSTPRPHTFDPLYKSAVTFLAQREHCGTKKSSRMSSTRSSAKTMQSFCYRPCTPNFWDLQTASGQSTLRTSPEESILLDVPSRFVQQEHSSEFPVQERIQAHTADLTMLSADDEQYSSRYEVTYPGSSETADFNKHCYNDNIDLPFSSCDTSSVALSALFTLPSSLPLTNKTWNPDAKPALGFDHTPSPKLVDSIDTTSWWESETTAAQPAFSAMENTLQFTSHNAEVQGLGITRENGSFAFGAASAHGLPSSISASFNLSTYSAMYPTQNQQRAASTSHLCSRTSSPNTKSRSHHRKTSSRSHHRISHSQGRRFSTSSQRSSSCRANDVGTSNVGFVNFTPEDSLKILSGVAPSGSSKTKARREKEATEKRRKLSQAAMKAVIEAGGDIDSIRYLDRDGLLIV
jgi:hypothetical protein